MKVILDLCGGTGAWSKPYHDNGYDVRIIDLPQDVRLLNYPGKIYGILAAPPCTHLSSSGARWWKTKGEIALRDAMSVVDACLRLVLVTNPRFWCLENPVGRLTRYLGKSRMTFHPYEYGDPYQKRTCLWGNFKIPIKNIVEPTEGMKLYLLPPSKDRSRLRSITPPGFAQAFYEVNK